MTIEKWQQTNVFATHFKYNKSCKKLHKVTKVIYILIIAKLDNDCAYELEEKVNKEQTWGEGK